MTDQWDTGDEDAFGEDFFASLEAAPDPEGGDAADADDVFAGAAGPDEFQYESEGDGSFETEAATGGAATEDFTGDFGADAEDFPFDLGGEG